MGAREAALAASPDGPLTRRGLLALSAAGLPAPAAARKKIAAIITEYRRNSHADVIAGRLLEGYEFNGVKRAPRLEVTAMYTDQIPSNDMSRAMAARHGVRVCPTVREALTAGPIDGVVLIGEHGNYPRNEKGQHLYPRYELFKQIVDVFRETGRAVPVFTDKHLSVDWEKAKWMYDQSRAMKFPLMAGSSVPIAWRRPPLELALETPVERAVASYYGPKEAYGFHALEALECMVERRKGGETGIRAVECFENAAVWQWTDRNPWAQRLLDRALAATEDVRTGSMRDNVKNPIAFSLEYADGLQAAVYILNGHVRNAAVALEIQGQAPAATEMWLQPGRPYSHFSTLVYYIEELIVNSRPSYPVERTLLTTGALAALMDASYQNKRLETPHLAVKYKAPKEPLYNRGAVPKLEEA